MRLSVTDTWRYRLSLSLLFLFAALFPITGATVLDNEDIRARMVLESYRRAFPDRVEAIEFVQGDWSVLVDGKRFFWATGRILPDSERQNASKYRPYVFYSYPDEIRNPESYSKEQIESLRKRGESEARINGANHHGDFQYALYGGATRVAAERNIVKTTLFGKQVSVHRRLLNAMRRIDAFATSLAKRDPEVAGFLASLSTVGGYNWREIRGTTRRSFHSWGLAVDLQPRKLGSAVTFWEWERERNKDWMLVPLKRRWAPPAPIIEVFEREGFVWGGKWDLYDTMHFEYRPELHEIKKVYASAGGIDIFGNAPAGQGGSELETSR
jgi:hypothetical protein